MCGKKNIYYNTDIGVFVVDTLDGDGGDGQTEYKLFSRYYYVIQRAIGGDKSEKLLDVVVLLKKTKKKN